MVTYPRDPLASLAQVPATIDIDVVPVDTSGRRLRLHTTPTTDVAVASIEITISGRVVRLDVLAASHRVAVLDRSVAIVTETVACSAGDGAPEPGALPDRSAWTAGGWSLAFSSTLVDGEDALIAARDAAEAAVAMGRGILARFPGPVDSVTALSLTALSLTAGDDHRLAWSTWHLYPGTDPHVVHTRTVATRIERQP